jgi:hypothetical protein
MNEKDLKIGDIVTTMFSINGHYYKVIAINSTDKLCFRNEKTLVGSVTLKSVVDEYNQSVGSWVDYLNPIKITDELLEKIGYRKTEVMENGLTSFTYNEICILHSKDDKMWRFHTNMSTKLIEYVHQLQHEMYDSGEEFKTELL